MRLTGLFRSLRLAAAVALMAASGCAVTVDHADVFSLRERQLSVETVALPDGFERGRVQALDLESDGRRFMGYRVMAPEPTRVVLFFPGNGYGASSALSGLVRLFSDQHTELWILSYGQLGEAPPKVGQMYAMARELAAKAVSTARLPPERVIAVGHSLGGWPALHLAATRRVGCVVIAGTGTDVQAVAAALLPKPVSMVVSLKPSDDVLLLDNLAQARKVVVPTLVLGSRADTMMPERFSQAIFENLGNKPASRLLLSPTASHAGYFRDAEITGAISAFIREKCGA